MSDSHLSTAFVTGIVGSGGFSFSPALTAVATGILAAGALAAFLLFGDIIAAAFNAILNEFISLFRRAVDVLMGLIEVVKNALKRLWEMVEKAVSFVLKSLEAVDSVDPNDIQKTLDEACATMKVAAVKLGETIKTFAEKYNIDASDFLKELKDLADKTTEEMMKFAATVCG